MGYLYHGDYEKALALYQANYGKVSKNNGEKGKTIFLKDLEDTATVVPNERKAEVEQMKAYLESLEVEKE